MSVCSEADELVAGQRVQDYGPPVKNLSDIAVGWSVVLGIPVSPQQVCLCMAWLKLARLAKTPSHHDSQVDVCGYIRLLEILT